MQETKREVLDDRDVVSLWDVKLFSWCVKPSYGLSGGILSSWLVGSWNVLFSFTG